MESKRENNSKDKVVPDLKPSTLSDEDLKKDMETMREITRQMMKDDVRLREDNSKFIPDSD